MSGRTIEPASITTLEEWATQYLKYETVTLDNGVPTVLSRTDNTVVKRIPVEKGFDLYAVLQGQRNDQGNEEKAYDAMDAERLVQKTAVKAAIPGFREAERQLLEALRRPSTSGDSPSPSKRPTRPCLSPRPPSDSRRSSPT